MYNSLSAPLSLFFSLCICLFLSASLSLSASYTLMFPGAGMIDNMVTVSGWCMASVLAIAVICPPFIVALVPMLFLYYRSMLYYRASARDTNRLQSVNTSPLISHFTETITGIVTIRGFGKTSSFLAENIMLTNHCHRPLFARQANQLPTPRAATLCATKL